MARLRLRDGGERAGAGKCLYLRPPARARSSSHPTSHQHAHLPMQTHVTIRGQPLKNIHVLELGA
eukprot:9884145-Lingulodinium_polyedra.AAC.1